MSDFPTYPLTKDDFGDISDNEEIEEAPLKLVSSDLSDYMGVNDEVDIINKNSEDMALMSDENLYLQAAKVVVNGGSMIIDYAAKTIIYISQSIYNKYDERYYDNVKTAILDYLNKNGLIKSMFTSYFVSHYIPGACSRLIRLFL